MANNQTIKDRLFLYIEYKGISARRFSTECGFSANYATNISKGIPEDKVNTISVHFPDLNTSWLMTGEGSMLRAETAANSFQEAEREEIRKLKERIKELEEQNEELREDKKYLKELLNSRGLSNCG